MEDDHSYGIAIPVLPSWQHQQQHSPWTETCSPPRASGSANLSPAETAAPPPRAVHTVPTQAPKDKLLRPTPTAVEWDTHKQVIHDLYMGHNLNLNEVVERLKVHGLYATARMYKAQFARWGWSKYASKRMRRDVSSGKTVVRSQGKSCYRIKHPKPKGRLAKIPSGSEAKQSPAQSTSDIPLGDPNVTPTSTTPEVPVMTSGSDTASPATGIAQQSASPIIVPKQMAHVNDTMRFLQSILTEIRSHVCEVSRKPEWNLGQMSKVNLIRGYILITPAEISSCDQFVSAIQSLQRKETMNGSRLLRRAFFDVAGSVCRDYPSVFYWCFIDLPHLFLHNGCDGILRFFLRYMKCLTTNSTLRDHIRGTGLAALHELAETDPTFLQHYVATASGLWYDLLVELRGPLDRSTILAQRNLLRHDRGPDYPSRVRRMCEDYSVLQSDVHARLGSEHPMTRHLDEAVLSAQLYHDYFLESFVTDNERLIRSLEAKYSTCVVLGDLSGEEFTVIQQPLDTWDVFDRHLRSTCHARLAYFQQLAGNTRQALAYGQRAREGWASIGFWHREAEAALVNAGRYQEADAIGRLRLEGQYYGKLPENDEMILPDAAVRHPTVFGIGVKFPGCVSGGLGLAAQACPPLAPTETPVEDCAPVLTEHVAVFWESCGPGTTQTYSV